MPRQSITEAQRAHLRQWVANHNLRPSQKDCIRWFKDTYHFTVSQSTISESLSGKFSRLDSTQASNRVRNRGARWPVLEDLLFKFQKHIESNGGSTTSEILQAKAQEIWHRIPDYQGHPPPEFSVGWLSRFKTRNNIRHRIQHGEAGSVPVTAEEEMKAVRTLCGEYAEDDIYNMDELGLFWRSAVNQGLLSSATPGRKQDKSRISIAVCCNSTGSDRLPIWFIGHAQKPRALKGLNFEALGCRWRANKKAWMTTIIMIDWLKAFYRHVGARSVILAMDNLKAHINGVEQAPPPSNIHIIWLPKNSTSVFQPLDQGIIRNLKAHYRKQWIQYIIDCIDTSINPFTTITLYQTIHWCLKAWYQMVLNTTIYQCFRKSTIIQPQISLPTDPPVDIHEQYQALQQRLPCVMMMEFILNPEDEDEEIDEAITFDDIIDEHLQDIETSEEAVLEDVEPQPEAVPSPAEALMAIQLLQRYQERQDGAQHHEFAYLSQFERQITALVASRARQSTLDNWIM